MDRIPSTVIIRPEVVIARQVARQQAAYFYGIDGLSERLIAKAFSGHRDRIVIANGHCRWLAKQLG